MVSELSRTLHLRATVVTMTLRGLSAREQTDLTGPNILLEHHGSAVHRDVHRDDGFLNWRAIVQISVWPHCDVLFSSVLYQILGFAQIAKDSTFE